MMGERETREEADAEARASRYRRIQYVLWLTLALNLAVAFAKYAVGSAIGSVSMRADGISSMFDGVSNLVGIAGLALAARPADDDHPYGHAKFETYASVAIGVMLVAAAYNVARDALEAFTGGSAAATPDLASFLVMAGTLAVNLGVSRYEGRVGREVGSEILTADAKHISSDALVSISVMVSLVLVRLGLPLADPVCSLLVAVAILRSAWEVFRQANETLSDKARIQPEEVEEAALSVEGVRSVHHVRSRGTESEVYVDLHVLLDPEMSLRDSHERGRQVSDAIRRRFPQVADVVVHVEPDTAEERAEA
ncbi:MAG: cation diffusion facilitator family transporter [Atopobiaceae bacterium]|jgi:cation diffusion facilitator family transporter|nr:cation diffusion facilitator family transporter [Atopobiaceae bacterium]MCH4120568.1 cation diffusion facilitator family transporter [Atopobiaceae bacterium]MCI1318739.1 cation diffusion facilitator family transporter [Atopobiaceae bacterium]MCI1389492.1 cation diffusion facilitator family transporter [Atopobiaceae bacterium]MCI1432227.1 cation diffusion facilitator family transporter [Atopobiaceae bacterium]